MECLSCKQKSTTKKVRARFVKAAKYDTDFCSVYANTAVNALYYNIFVCPHCGFSYSGDFSRYFPLLRWKSLWKKSASSGFPIILARRDPLKTRSIHTSWRVIAEL
ncbi:DUF2225 domain-containing protein [Peribacillus simplex]|uniref:DUF2225 domain-containing protein n=1 Tax=Peribacillus simplex TaxID=1478 RepID=UPI0035CCE19D